MEECNSLKKKLNKPQKNKLFENKISLSFIYSYMDKIQITRPKKKEISFQLSEKHNDKIRINTITGRTFDSSPSFILEINFFTYYFNFPEMQQKHLIQKYYRGIPSPHNIFITSLYPDSIGGLSLFFLQNINNLDRSCSLTGPKEISKVILLDPDYFGKKISKFKKLKISDNYEDRFIKAIPIVLSKSVSYDILLKNINEHFLVLDCRSIDDLQLLPNLKEFSIIIHLTIPEILLQSEYITFFTENEQNLLNFCFMPSGIISNYQSEKYYTCRSNHFLQPLSFGKTLKCPPGFVDFTSKDSSYDFISKKISIEGKGPETEFDMSNKYEDNDSNNKTTLNDLDILSQLIDFEPNLPEFNKYAITFLGSGTKHVSPKMNLSGYLIHTKYGFVVFDPSEGFFNQLKRKFGPKTTKYILENIECIWISHYHQDHILGSPSLLYERAKITDKQIYFFAPQKFINDIKMISELYGDFHLIYNNREPEGYKFLSDDPISTTNINDDDDNSRSQYDKYKTDKSKNIKDQYSSEPTLFKINDHLSIQSIDVSHCEHTKGCLLSIDGEKSIAFSGDHGYNKDYFADVFQNCDLLIHEATFPVYVRERIGDITNHCYLDEAISTAISMNPRITCLTHFSQRYNKDDLLYRPADNIMLAFDFLEFTSENALDVFTNCSKKLK